MNYTARFKDKDAAWFIYKRLRDGARYTSGLNHVRIKDSTFIVPNECLPKVQNMADRIKAQYSLKVS